MTRATNLSRWETDGGHIEELLDEARHAQADHVGRQMVAYLPTPVERTVRRLTFVSDAAAAADEEPCGGRPSPRRRP